MGGSLGTSVEGNEDSVDGCDFRMMYAWNYYQYIIIKLYIIIVVVILIIIVPQ